MARRRICVVTGSRAEYGLLRWLVKEIAADDDLLLQIVATGSHLLPAFGDTWREIVADNNTIDEKVAIGPDDDTPLGAVRALSRATEGLAGAFARLTPDIVVVLGDRYEILGAATAALLLKIPVAHIHGGEITEGALDDSIRHAVTKLSHLHFAATETYARRIVQMGEDPTNVFNVGALGVDAAQNTERASKAELEKILGIELASPLFVVTYHPVTRADGPPNCGINALLVALAGFDDARIVFTGVNADPGFSAIGRAIREFAADRPSRVRYVESLGARRYLSLIELANALIGNSSSGIIEAPALKIPTVNIGERQKGRLRAPSVIDCAEDAEEIRKAVSEVLRGVFAETLGMDQLQYAGGGVAARICAALKQADLADLRRKPFCDLSCAAAA